MAEGIAGPTWRLLLLGGTTASGKSTSGRLVARRLGISCISADSIWKALQQATSAATHPAFHHFEPSPEVYARGPDHLAELHAEAAEAMTEALNTFIDWELHDGNRFVFEGAWITPALAARQLRSAELLARAVFIDEPEERAILTIHARTKQTHRTTTTPVIDFRDGLALRQLDPRTSKQVQHPHSARTSPRNISRPHHRSGRIGAQA